MHYTVYSIWSGAMLLAALSLAQATTNIHVTFDVPPVRPPGFASHGAGYYLESGVSTIAQGLGFTRRWSGDPSFPDNGTAYIQPTEGGHIYFDYIGRTRPFSAVSVDLALYSTASLEPVMVRFEAYSYRGPVGPLIASIEFSVSGVVDSEGRPAFQTFYFPPAFRDMDWLYAPAAGTRWSLDNLVIIPEPSTGALLALGLGGLLLARARRSGCPGAPPPARNSYGAGGLRHESNPIWITGDCQP